MNKFYITTPIYYVNGDPHIGGAYTTIASDVIARFYRLRGYEVYFLTGTDEHGNKIAQTAQKAGKTPQEFADINSAKFQTLFDRLDISNDYFIRTTEAKHKKGVVKFLTTLKDNDAIYEDEYEGLYCTGCEKFITDKELTADGKCAYHQKAPEFISEKNYFFKLSNYIDQVKELIDKDKILILPKSRKKEVLGLFKQGLDDFSVSRESVKWGIKLPFDSKQVAYVWVDALTNYINAIGYGEDEKKFKKFWPADVHFIGKDILKFHVIYWPALLLAAGLKPPKAILAHGFFTVDGQKMSKSLGNVIDPNDLLDEFGSDGARWLMLSQFPFGSDGDVKAGDFVIQYNADLANGIGNLVSRVLSMSEKYTEGVVPPASTRGGEPTRGGEKDFEFSDEVAGVWNQYKKALKNYEIDKAIEVIKKWQSFCDGYIERNKPWELAKQDPEKLNKVLYNLLEGIRQLGLLIYPILPQTAEKIQDALGQKDWNGKEFKELIDWGRLEPGTKIKKGEPLFPRLEKKEEKK